MVSPGENSGAPKLVGSIRRRDGNVSGPGKTSTEESVPWTIDKVKGRARRPAGIATLDFTLAKESILPC
jgi:hypothetical protein